MMHDDQLPVDADVAAGLLATQFPEWRDELVEPVHSTGTENAIFRVGENLTARFPCTTPILRQCSTPSARRPRPWTS
ncbi:hypothetical protein GCM10025867_28220 [Frondihabitans sucicola]|uniref:Aminoglycoside phosphotransferase domain-containing protein n=1 Tax=Frondihabitans sucicola TaxID=1268041 RepID=A0ABM8GQN2_9MICO|nr:hypothetical protein [Frondihabitans sucicola]BDZ50581.1 hypothetical protein GCM10025867_28220 [Frondihabitans sucicola]